MSCAQSLMYKNTAILAKNMFIAFINYQVVLSTQLCATSHVQKDAIKYFDFSV